MEFFSEFKQSWKGVLIAVIIGIVSVLISEFSKISILDPLLLAMIIGIVIRSNIQFESEYLRGFNITPLLFIPCGIVFYGAVNLNFRRVATVDSRYLISLFIIFVAYMVSVLLLAKLLKLKKKVAYLVASGSAICGASAIVITSKSIDADPDETSISLVSVFVSAVLGLVVLLPFLGKIFSVVGKDYGVFAGSVLQFTGFVKAAVLELSKEARSLALSVKAVRYLGLIIIIPLFASLVKRKLHVPWYLWAFLGSGLLFTFMPQLAKVLNPVLKRILKVLWSIAMGSIGLNATLEFLYSKEGLKVFIVSFVSFLVAISVFIITTIAT